MNANPDAKKKTGVGEECRRKIDRKEFTPEQKASLKCVEEAMNKALRDYHNAEHRELKTELEKIGQALDELKVAKQDNVVHHRHAIEIVSSKVLISMIVMGLFILGLSYAVGTQRRTISQYRDNDLKYHYIKMHGEATPGDIKALETIFTYKPNTDSIKIIRQQVIQYERLIKEQAEKI